MKTKYLFLIYILCTGLLKAQDMHFTQFYAAPMYLNPAFAGSNVCSRASLIYRNQWPGINTAYKTYMFSADHHIAKSPMNAGLAVASDVAGSASLRTTIIYPTVAYETYLNRTYSIRLGVQPGIGMQSINYEKFLFGSEIVSGVGDRIENPIRSTAYFDANAGLLLHSERAYIGASFFHLNRPNESLMGATSKLPIKYSIHGGYTYNMSGKSKDILEYKELNVVFHYRGQRKFSQLDLGVYYNQYIFTVGFWYRGLPIVKSYAPGYSNNDAVAFLVGYKKDRISIGYSYDLTISRLYKSTSGAHELSLSYQYCPPAKKIKPRRRVACAKF
jgi:type IX secretion system PorP/SprF family membrane protein